MSVSCNDADARTSTSTSPPRATRSSWRRPAALWARRPRRRRESRGRLLRQPAPPLRALGRPTGSARRLPRSPELREEAAASAAGLPIVPWAALCGWDASHHLVHVLTAAGPRCVAACLAGHRSTHPSFSFSSRVIARAEVLVDTGVPPHRWGAGSAGLVSSAARTTCPRGNASDGATVGPHIPPRVSDPQTFRS